jgi:hypothetical protein
MINDRFQEVFMENRNQSRDYNAFVTNLKIGCYSMRLQPSESALHSMVNMISLTDKCSHITQVKVIR